MKIGDHVMIYWSCYSGYIGMICKVRRITNKRFYCEDSFDFDFDNGKNEGSKYMKLSPAMKIMYGVE